MYVSVFSGRKINKAACCLCLMLGSLSLAAGVILMLLGKGDFGSVFMILAMIFGGFALFYGLLWLIWSVKEKKAARKLAEADAAAAAARDEGPARFECREFILPKESLAQTAWTRYKSIVKWTGIVIGVIFVGITVLLAVNDSLKDPVQLLYLLLLCLAISVPGLIIQRVIYARYERAIPGRILLYPGKLVIDDKLFAAGDILTVRISSDMRSNANSTAIYREMIIRTDHGASVYRFDFRIPDPKKGTQPRWEEYRDFALALTDWGKQNEVDTAVDYMD